MKSDKKPISVGFFIASTESRINIGMKLSDFPILLEDKSTDSIVDWFTSSIKSACERGAQIAEKTYDTTGNDKLARMHGGAAIGKWYAENVINRGGPSVALFLKLLQPHNVKLPDILGTGLQKEQGGYSNSGNLRKVIADISPVLKAKGYDAAVDSLQRSLDSYAARISQIGLDDDEPVEQTVKKTDMAPQYTGAEQIVMDIIKQLPANIQADVRRESARKGNTLQALRTILAARGIKL